MAWTTRYCQFPDEATAREFAMQLGVEFPEDGTIPTGNQNYALHAPMQPPWQTEPIVDAEGQIVTPGVPEPGFWAMLRFNDDWSGHDQTLVALDTAGVVRDLPNPPVVWA